MTRRKPRRYQLEQAKRRCQELINRLLLAEIQENEDIMLLCRVVETQLQLMLDELIPKGNERIIRELLASLDEPR